MRCQIEILITNAIIILVLCVSERVDYLPFLLGFEGCCSCHRFASGCFRHLLTVVYGVRYLGLQI